jgi:hypothetical protein
MKKQELLIYLTEQGETTTLELLNYKDGKLKEKFSCNYYQAKESFIDTWKKHFKPKQETKN